MQKFTKNKTTSITNYISQVQHIGIQAAPSTSEGPLEIQIRDLKEFLTAKFQQVQIVDNLVLLYARKPPTPILFFQRQNNTAGEAMMNVSGGNFGVDVGELLKEGETLRLINGKCLRHFFLGTKTQ